MKGLDQLPPVDKAEQEADPLLETSRMMAAPGYRGAR
jgi:hypothetical protein